MVFKKFWVAAAIAGGFFGMFLVRAAPAAPVIWNGPNVSFSKPAFGNPSLPANQDRITDSVWITRGNTNGLYNAKTEVEFSFGVSPENTEWAWAINNPGETIAASNYQNLTFDIWYFAHNHSPPSTVNQPGVLHIISDDIYIDIMFTSWGQGSGGGGAFSYVRSTEPPAPICPADLNGDQTVDVTDLFQLLSAWSTNGPGADLASPNNVVDVNDLFVLLAAWGDC